MRTYLEALTPALQSCRLLGPADAADCAQGAFHDYWLAIEGADQTRMPAGGAASPRAHSGRQTREFVRACWYRALLEHPPPGGVETATGVLTTCRGLHGLQHSACVTAASLIVSADPFEQMQVCARLRGDDAASCVRGVRIPAVAGDTTTQQLQLLARCARLDPAARNGCYFWLGKGLAVVTNGGFLRTGCTRLPRPDATACRAGARTYQGPLETFS
jgi:hypothetical protein